MKKLTLLFVVMIMAGGAMAQDPDKIDMYPQMGMTFFWGSSTPTIQNAFGKTLKNELI